MPLYGADGQPIEPPTVVDEGLPRWCVGVSYRAGDDVCTLRLRIPVETPMGEHLLDVHLESLTSELERLHGAIGRVLDAARGKPAPSAGLIIDVPSD